MAETCAVNAVRKDVRAFDRTDSTEADRTVNRRI